MKNSRIEKIHEIDLEGLKEFKKICDEEEISFFLRGGSVMGAVKYHGFIPWDDDMDIAVPRKDYEKLISVFENKVIGNKFVIYSYRYNDKMHSYFPRMLLLESERKHLALPANTNLGLHLMDIIPLDGSPDNILKRKLFFMKVYVLRALASAGTVYSGVHKNPHSKKQQMIVKCMRTLKLHKIFKQKDLYRCLDRLFSKYPWKQSKYSGTITASLGMKESFPSEYWGKGIKMKFEDTVMLVPQEYDKYLKQLYGENYRDVEPHETAKKSHFIEDGQVY